MREEKQNCIFRLQSKLFLKTQLHELKASGGQTSSTSDHGAAQISDIDTSSGGNDLQQTLDPWLNAKFHKPGMTEQHRDAWSSWAPVGGAHGDCEGGVVAITAEEDSAVGLARTCSSSSSRIRSRSSGRPQQQSEQNTKDDMHENDAHKQKREHEHENVLDPRMRDREHWRCFHCWTPLESERALCRYCKDKTIAKQYTPT